MVAKVAAAPIVEIIGAAASYRRIGKPQIQGLDFVANDEITALIGRNGAGKSTLMKTILGTVRLRTGEIQVLGFNPFLRRERQLLMSDVGYLPQQFGYVPSFTVLEFVAYAAWLKGLPSATARTCAELALERVGITELRSKKMGQLSGGMRRRAGIAQAIVHSPKLLILDEPTTGLDPEQRVKFRKLISDLAETSAVILSSHLVEDVRFLAQKITILEAGQNCFTGTPAELEAQAQTDLLDATLRNAEITPLEKGYLKVISKDRGETNVIP
ncbi:ATP-binding cassette domain-containing protein [Canibacter zhoujuaniae]|uniref:ATP-binding cassette domain-containing protein n=1 Tax=Canibacter zhoujuaniae TaxID=2708343 RepID=UPI0014248B8F|nr:ATP-binding cassette domain-containing protein [Canibacter zhoujuaniae]